MNRRLARFDIDSRKHATDEGLVGLMDSEIRTLAARKVQQQIEACSVCRSRLEQTQAPIIQFMSYLRQITDSHLPPPSEGRSQFIAALDERIKLTRVLWSRPDRI